MNALLANQAIDLAIAAILSAFSVLILNVAGYIQLRGQGIRQGEKLQAVKEQVQQQGGTGAPTVLTVTAPPAGGQAAVALSAPADNQLTDPLPDGQLDPYRTTSCGEECASMAIEACGGPSIAAGQLRVLLGGLKRPGFSTGVDIVYLLSLFKVPSHPRQADPDTSWIEWEHSFQAKFLVIARGYWVTVGYPHWVLIRQTTAEGILFNDPWGGQVRSMDKATAQKLYLGDYVHVDQAVSAPAAAPPSE